MQARRRVISAAEVIPLRSTAVTIAVATRLLRETPAREARRVSTLVKTACRPRATLETPPLRPAQLLPPPAVRLEAPLAATPVNLLSSTATSLRMPPRRRRRLQLRARRRTRHRPRWQLPDPTRIKFRSRRDQTRPKPPSRLDQPPHRRPHRLLRPARLRQRAQHQRLPLALARVHHPAPPRPRVQGLSRR